MLEFLIDIIFVMLGEHVIQKTDNILMSTDCVPPLVDLFLYLHEACNSRNMNRLAWFFNFMFRYIADDVLSLIIQNLVIMLITSIAYKETSNSLRYQLTYTNIIHPPLDLPVNIYKYHPSTTWLFIQLCYQFSNFIRFVLFYFFCICAYGVLCAFCGKHINNLKQISMFW